MTTRVTLGPPVLGAPVPSDAGIIGDRHGDGAVRVTVLAIVTDPETADLFGRVVGQRDRLVLAGDLAEAIALAEAESPEVVFLDVGVAAGAGLALVHHVKVVAPGATVFAMAAKSNVEAGAHAVALGAAGLFVMPLGGDEILNAVHAVRARMVEKATRSSLLAELRAHARASAWTQRMAELDALPSLEAATFEAADVIGEAANAAGAAVYLVSHESTEDTGSADRTWFTRRAAIGQLADAPPSGAQSDLMEHARQNQITVVKLGARGSHVGLVLLRPDPDRSAAAEEPGGPLDGIVRTLATQAATALALRVERDRRTDGAWMKDPGSSTYSFAYYVDVAGREIDRARRHHRRFSIATVVIGDAAGRPGLDGPAGAAEVGDRLLAAVTDTDVVARVDQNEFHLLLPETDGLGAHAVRRRIFARLAGERRALPRGVLVGVATFPHDGRDLSRLLRVARRRADREGSSIVHDLPQSETSFVDLYEAAERATHLVSPRSAGDVTVPRWVSFRPSDAAVLVSTAIVESLRGGAVLGIATQRPGMSIGAAARATFGPTREGFHAIDLSANPTGRDIDALVLFAEHGTFAFFGKNDGQQIRGLVTADALFADFIADRLGRAAGVRVLG